MVPYIARFSLPFGGGCFAILDTAHIVVVVVVKQIQKKNYIAFAPKKLSFLKCLTFRFYISHGSCSDPRSIYKKYFTTSRRSRRQKKDASEQERLFSSVPAVSYFCSTEKTVAIKNTQTS